MKKNTFTFLAIVAAAVAAVLLVRAGDANGAPGQGAPRSASGFGPAFPGQTRAPAVKTRTALQVTEVASGFDRPWAIAFLPDRRMLVTEKPSGALYIVSPDGKRSPPVAGPSVAGFTA